MPSLRAIATVLLLAGGMTLWLMPTTARAAGPGVTLVINTQPREIEIPGSRFAGGVTIRSLLQSIGLDPVAVTFVNVTRSDGASVPLTQDDLGAMIIDNGRTTRFVHGSTRISATADTGPLQLSVNGGDISVVASVDRNDIQANERVTLSARVRFSPPGATLRYEWDFNDGTPPKRGQTVSHVYTFAGSYQPRVTVTGSGGSTRRCATTCVGHDDVDVTVGEPPPEPTTPGSGGTGGPSGAGTGSGSGSGAGGQGGAGGAGGTGSDPSGTPKPRAEPKPKPRPKPKKPFGVTISGVLISDPGTTLSKLPGGTPAGGSPGRRTDRDAEGDAWLELPLTALGAFMVFSLGALRERRAVRLRVA